MSFRKAISGPAAVLGALSVAACAGQSASTPYSGVRVPTYAAQSSESRPASLLTGGVPAQTQETVLYSFGDGIGAYPQTGLTNVDGVLYGTTLSGRDDNCDGLGATVYKITTSGVVSVLHRFGSYNGDGLCPQAGLLNVNGVLYGTTASGGANFNGTVFKITTSGAESVLYSFGSIGGGDGANPTAGLINVDGVLYGTTYSGGAADEGSVFKITTSGEESVIHSFSVGGLSNNGAYPEAGLTEVDGVLYGTTSTSEPPPSYGFGTVFKITTSGTESVIYTFKGGSDGGWSDADLTNVNGVLYGTTPFGGATGANGTVFRITTSGAESVLHSFGGGNDGREPFGPLTNINGVLYGTTYRGGADRKGTIFKISTSGAKSDLYSFKGFSDGANPFAGLTNVNGVLYGTTNFGGADRKGTVFSLPL